MGKGVMTAVKLANEIIAPALIGMDPTQQVRDAWGVGGVVAGRRGLTGESEDRKECRARSATGP